jgi:hypothetical protein
MVVEKVCYNTTLSIVGVEEDLLFSLWFIYIEDVLLVFLPNEGFPG